MTTRHSLDPELRALQYYGTADVALTQRLLQSLRPPRPWWWRIIVPAIPSCTLWVYDPCLDLYYFRFWPRWYVTTCDLWSTQ